MKKILLLGVILATAGFTGRAQTSEDALRYSLSSLTGTARYVSMGGAFGALGADMSSISSNPAGIGVFRKSEVSFSPAFYFANNKANYLGGEATDSRFNFNFGHAGMVFTFKLSKDDKTIGWKSWNFGLVYNRLDNYQTTTFMQGFNPRNSLLDYYLQNANRSGGVDPSQLDQFYEYQAYQTYLINPDTNTGVYSSVIPNGNITQRRSATTKGSRGETVFSFGGNYNNKLYIGMNIGIANLRYESFATYDESDSRDTIFDFRSFNLNENFTTHGVGWNMKFGIIYKANDMVRIGLAVHTPTWYDMHDDYGNTTNSYFDNGDAYSYSSDLGVFDYDLTTPFRAIGSLAFVIGKSGLISGDYEFVDYGDAELHSPSYPFYDENTTIRTTYGSTQNIRLGTEWNYGNMSFRGGYAYFGSPFKANVKNSDGDLSKNSFSIGLGMKDGPYFIDFGYVYSISHYLFLPYTLNNGESPVSINKFQSHNLTITLGAKF